MTDLMPTPEMSPEVEDKPMVPLWLFLLALVVTLAAVILAGFSSYSVKKTEDKVSQAGVTVYSWKEVAGKAYPVTEYGTQYIHDQTSTTIKSGCALGVAISTKGSPGVYLAPDILGFGPGNIQLLGMASKDEVIGGIGYRLNF